MGTVSNRVDHMMRQVQADTNRRLAEVGLCVMHNSGEHVRAQFVVEVPIGNRLPMCARCVGLWFTDLAEDTGGPTAPVLVVPLLKAADEE